MPLLDSIDLTNNVDDILKCLQPVEEARRDVSWDTIVNCFRKSGLKIGEDTLSQERAQLAEILEMYYLVPEVIHNFRAFKNG